jgi:hypothetical protein
MKIIFNIYWKIFVLPFFQRNTGLFLFLFVVLFGVAQNPKLYHIQLMQSILSSNITLFVVIIFWLLYGIKTVFFIVNTLQEPANSFLINMQMVNPKITKAIHILVQLLLLAPILIYAIIVSMYGFTIGHTFPAIIILVFIALLVCITSFISYTTAVGRGVSISLPSFPITYPKHFYLLLVWYHLLQKKIRLFTIKLLSFTALFIPVVWNNGHADLSDFVLFLHVSVAAHAIIIFDNVQYLNTAFPLLRNMPISRFKIYALHLITCMVLLLPEAAILLYHVPKTNLGVHAISIIFFMAGQLVFITSIAYEKNLSQQEHTAAVAFVCIGLLFLLPHGSFWVIGLSLLAAGFLLFHSIYYKYEPSFLPIQKNKKNQLG